MRQHMKDWESAEASIRGKLLLSAKEQVAAVLRKAILSRDLDEGQEITLEGIATMVGVSSMPDA